ncbi:ornithine cyclodeaminase [Arthrobacter crystallopoietes BAB-32]|uniref:Ornithine cyclodeaminase n=1 Tax=Arthrobacter crystallopoietes BAB-32 TaxID=1246476 RepID=N1V836_9MICC|nr:ornithine cyclodeaminase family protein [Arthrobacter crystallopoietes]EMY36169.1 ornithine cyclodeaminase [Arthrobacter crystallopoietes BAB-32]
MSIPYFDAAAIRSTVPFDRAVRAIEDALADGVDPEMDSPRLFSPAPDGEFLIMPTEGGHYSGVKTVTIAPKNPSHGLEKIQGIYILIDSATLAPLALMDGAALTAVRTPATTITAVKHIAAAAPANEGFGSSPQILVFGAGVQALNHIRAARAVFRDARFGVIGKRAHRVSELAQTLAAEDIEVVDKSGDVASAVANADIILCVTSSSDPLFDGGLPKDGAIVASVGQHGLDAREVDAKLVMRSDVVVEGRASSWRESGNLIPARSVEEWQEIEPPNLRDLVSGGLVRRQQTCCLYTGVGMAWEDLVTAAVVYEEGKDHARRRNGRE